MTQLTIPNWPWAGAGVYADSTKARPRRPDSREKKEDMRMAELKDLCKAESAQMPPRHRDDFDRQVQQLFEKAMKPLEECDPDWLLYRKISVRESLSSQIACLIRIGKDAIAKEPGAAATELSAAQKKPPESWESLD